MIYLFYNKIKNPDLKAGIQTLQVYVKLIIQYACNNHRKARE